MGADLPPTKETDTDTTSANVVFKGRIRNSNDEVCTCDLGTFVAKYGRMSGFYCHVWGFPLMIMCTVEGILR